LRDVRQRELQIIDMVCEDIRVRGKLSNRNRARLLAVFAKRFENAERIVQRGGVRTFLFLPSERVIWSVEGRKSEYQVIPDSNYCSCDDYYFRVVDREKQLCYHLIAQKLAESLQKFQTEELIDSQYSTITRKWSANRTSTGQDNEN
jgi:predicted nucleic acid-binding Zn finger protein